MSHIPRADELLAQFCAGVDSAFSIQGDAWTPRNDVDALKAAYNAAQSHLVASSEAALEHGDPQKHKDVRPIHAGIQRVLLQGAVEVVLRQGEVPSMSVCGVSAEAVSRIRTTLQGDLLHIAQAPDTIIESGGAMQMFFGKVRHVAAGSIIKTGGNTIIEGDSYTIGNQPMAYVEITLPNVRGIEVAGAVALVYTDINQPVLSLDVAGAASVELSGLVGRLACDASGASTVKGHDLKARDACITASGAASIKLCVQDAVRASAAGVASIKVSGKPPIRESDASGMAKIKFV